MEDKIKKLIDLYYTDKKICKELHIAQKTLIKYKNKNNILNSRIKFQNIDLNHCFFEEIRTEEQAYWLGFLYADGCVYKNKLIINLIHSDSLHLIKLQKTLNYNIKPIIRKRSNNRGQNYCNFTISSKKMCNDLIKLGCTPNKTFSLKFPTEEQVPKHLIHHFIRGFFDGDGCISKVKYYSYTFCGTEDMINGINNILVKNQIIKKPISISKARSKNLHIIKKSGNIGVILFKNYLYKDATIYLERKKEKFDDVIQTNKLLNTCKICNNKFFAKGFCSNHYQQQRYKENKLTNEKNRFRTMD